MSDKSKTKYEFEDCLRIFRLYLNACRSEIVERSIETGAIGMDRASPVRASRLPSHQTILLSVLILEELDSADRL